MRLLFFLFGACIASLVWAFILMRVLDHDIRAYDDSYEMLHEFMQDCTDFLDNIAESAESMDDLTHDIQKNNSEFRTEVVKLFEIISKCMR